MPSENPAKWAKMHRERISTLDVYRTSDTGALPPKTRQQSIHHAVVERCQSSARLELRYVRRCNHLGCGASRGIG